GPMVLALGGMLSALLSDLSHRFVSSPMATAVEGSEIDVHIGVVPHIGMPLLLSLITVALGIAAYLWIERGRAAMAAVLEGMGWGPDRGFDQAMRGAIRLSLATTGIVQNGRLDFYMTATFIAVALSLFLPMLIFGEMPSLPS